MLILLAIMVGYTLGRLKGPSLIDVDVDDAVDTAYAEGYEDGADDRDPAQ